MKYLTLFISFFFGTNLFCDLTLEKRIEAQKKIEKVFYEKRIWPKENPNPKPPFEEMVSEEAIKRKVEDYLKKSAALEEFWNNPITGEELQAEIERMVKQSKDPETLKALFSALNNDPMLIAECIARPNLAERLVNTYYAYDKKFHREKLEEIQAIYRDLKVRNIEPSNINFYRKVHIKSGNCEKNGLFGIECFDSEEFEKISSNFPSVFGFSEIKETPDGFIIYITENKSSSELKGGIIYLKKQGIDEFLKNYYPNLNINVPNYKYKLPQKNKSELVSLTPTAPNSWEPLWYIPEGRESHLAIWTGSEMIVWGGKDAFTTFKT